MSKVKINLKKTTFEMNNYNYKILKILSQLKTLTYK